MNNNDLEIPLDTASIKEPKTENSSDEDDDEESNSQAQAIIQNEEEESNSTKEKQTVEEVKAQQQHQDKEQHESKKKLQTQKERNKPTKKTNKRKQLRKSSTLKKESKVNPILTLSTKTNRVTNDSKVTIIDNASKSIYTQITESIFLQNIKAENKHQPKVYELLLSDNYVSRVKDRTQSKDNQKKFCNMITRHHQYSESLNFKSTQRKEKDDEKFRQQYTFKPNVYSNENSRVQSPTEFYSMQKEFVKQKENNIKKLKEDKDKREKELLSKTTTQISKKSYQIAESKYLNETQTDFCNRLHSSKMVTDKQKTIEEKELKIPLSPLSSHHQKRPDDIYKYSNKLHEHSILMKSRREDKVQKKIEEEDLQRKNDLISQSTAKIILQKLLNSFEKEKKVLFSDNCNSPKTTISYEDYSKLMKQMGFVLGCNSNANDSKLVNEGLLLRSSYDKYIHHQQGEGESGRDYNELNYCLLFSLAVVGIYKGKENKRLDEQSKSTTLSQTINNKSTQEKLSFQDLSRLFLPHFNFEAYYYSSNTVKAIRTAYSQLYNNLSCHWAKQRTISKDRRFNNKSFSTPNEKEIKDRAVSRQKHKAKPSQTKALSKNKILTEDNPLDNITINIKELTIEEGHKYQQKAKNKELNHKRDLKLKEEMKDCTFQPNSTKKVSKNVMSHIEELYSKGKNKCHRKLFTEGSDENTFKPITYTLNTDMFCNDPLCDDIQLRRTLVLREKARMTKDIISLQVKKGFTSTGFTSIQSSNNELTPVMKFDLEKKSGKDTFNHFNCNYKLSLRKSKNKSTEIKRENE